MKIKDLYRHGVVLGLLWLAAAALPAFAQSLIFLDFTSPSIQGESTTLGYSNMIHVTSASHGIANPACSGGKAVPSEFTFTKLVDKASVDMYAALNSRTVFGTARFRFAQNFSGNYVVYQEYEFQNVLLSAASAAGTTSDARPAESWSLSYSQVTIRYFFIDGKGKQDAPESVVIGPAACGP